MKQISCICLSILILVCLSGCEKEETSLSPEHQALKNAVSYLWEQQAYDGGWHSERHTLLKGGAAYTPYILYALMEVPDSIYPKSERKISKALAFIRQQMNDDGALGLKDPDILEYPNYATAYALRVMAIHGHPGDEGLIKKMQDYLVSQQYTETRGIEPSHVAYGGWGFGETNLSSGVTGQIDLSHTRRVLQALTASRFTDKEVYEKAQNFLRLLQKDSTDQRVQPGVEAEGYQGVPYDGGFYYSPVVYAANKGGQVADDSTAKGYFRSYATATCDGILALLACGASKDDVRVRMGMQWLMSHPFLSFPEGVPMDDPNQWHRVMKFYHYAVRAQVYAALDWEIPWKGELLELIIMAQEKDGSFSNPEGNLNKEDDPLLATSLAVIAMRLALNTND